MGVVERGSKMNFEELLEEIMGVISEFTRRAGITKKEYLEFHQSIETMIEEALLKSIPDRWWKPEE